MSQYFPKPLSDYKNIKLKIDLTNGKQNYLVFLPLRKYFELNSVAGAADDVLS